MKLPVFILTALASHSLAQDVLHFHTGDAFKGEIESVDAAQVHFKVVIEGPSGRGEARWRVPFKDIAFIDFAQTEVEAAIAEGSSPGERSTLQRLWQGHEPYLEVANSPAGAYGLALVEHLLDGGTSPQATEALGIAERVMAADWDEDRRQRAKQWRLQALALAGRTQEAKEAARNILDEATDARLVVEARQVLGYAAFDALRDLLEEHPRWMDDDEIRPQCDALLHQAIDHFLYPSLFHGSLEEPAARGLWQVCQIHRHAQRPNKARAAAHDLVGLYPNSPEAELAQRYLEASQQ